MKIGYLFIGFLLIIMCIPELLKYIFLNNWVLIYITIMLFNDGLVVIKSHNAGTAIVLKTYEDLKNFI